MNKKIVGIIALISILLFIFSGCVQIETNLKVKEDGKGDMAIIMDMSGIKTLMEGMYGSMPEEQKQTAFAELDANYGKENICNTIKQASNDDQVSQLKDSVPGGFGKTDFKNSKCEALDDYKAKMTIEDIDLIENKVLVIEEGLFSKKYILEVGSEGENKSTETTPAQMTQMKAMGLSMKMSIEMPGEIKEVTPLIGTIGEGEKKNTLTIDLIENSSALNSGKIVIVSETANMMPLIIGGVVLVLIIAGILLVVVMKKK